MYVRTDGISPHSTGLRPLSGPLPKKECYGQDLNPRAYYLRTNTLPLRHEPLLEENWNQII